MLTRQEEGSSFTSQAASNKQITERLSLSERTVEHYRADIYRKLNVHNADELKALMSEAAV